MSVSKARCLLGRLCATLKKTPAHRACHLAPRALEPSGRDSLTADSHDPKKRLPGIPTWITLVETEIG